MSVIFYFSCSKIYACMEGAGLKIIFWLQGILEMDCTKLEWQIFHDTEKITEIEYKIENTVITENSVFATQKNKKYPRKLLFLKYLKVKFIIKNLRLVKLLWKFNKNFIVYICQCGIGRPTLLISALSDTAFLQKHCVKS